MQLKKDTLNIGIYYFSIIYRPGRLPQVRQLRACGHHQVWAGAAGQHLGHPRFQLRSGEEGGGGEEGAEAVLLVVREVSGAVLTED